MTTCRSSGITYSVGDIVIITNDKKDHLSIGDLVGFYVEGRDLLILHRIVEIHKKSNGEVLT